MEEQIKKVERPASSADWTPPHTPLAELEDCNIIKWRWMNLVWIEVPA